MNFSLFSHKHESAGNDLEEKSHLKTFYARHQIKPWESLVTLAEVEENTVFCSLNNSSLVLYSLQKLDFWAMIGKIV